MNTQKNTTVFQIVAVVLSSINTILAFCQINNMLSALLMLAGTALMIFGFLKGTVKPLIVGSLVNMASRLYASFIATKYYLWNYGYGEVRWDAVQEVFVQDAVTVPVGDIVSLFIPPIVWLLFAIAIWRKDKAVLVCTTAAVVNLYQSIQSFGGFNVTLIRNLLLCAMLIISGMAIQGGMQSVFAPRPVESLRGASNQYENLIKLKDLLDSGAITQEEFDQKKKELLEV